MADLISINWAETQKALDDMSRFGAALDNQAAQVQQAFNNLATVYGGATHDNAVASALRVQQARTNLSATLNLLRQGVDAHQRDIYTMDQQQALRIGGV